MIEDVKHREAPHNIFNLKDFFSGLMAGFAQTIVGQPMDYIKTQIQMAGRKLTLSETAKLIWKEAGLNIFTYYRGSSTMFLGNGLLVSQELGLNESFHRFFRNYVNKNDVELLPMYQVGLCGTMAGYFCSLIYTPMEFCKIQMQMKTYEFQKYRSGLHILYRMTIEGQWRRLFRGGLACNLREGLGGTIYFLAYEGTLRALMKPGQISHSDSSDTDIIIAGAAAGFFIVPVYPVDVVKTQVQSGFCSSYSESIAFCR